MQTTDIDPAERSRRVVVFHAANVSQVRPYADVAAQESRQSTADVNAEVIVRQRVAVQRAVDASSNQTDAAGHVRTYARSASAVERNADRHVPHRRQQVAIQVVPEKVRRVAEVDVDADYSGNRRARGHAEVDSRRRVAT